MSKINIVGLGPGSIDDLTLSAVKKIEDENRKYIRTIHHPTVKYFDDKNIEYKAYDYIYDSKDEFIDVYENIALDLAKEAKKYGEINYFVPGNPMIAEKTVEILLKDDTIDTVIISGMSFIEPMLQLVKRDPISGLKIIDGAEFKKTLIDINTDIIITQTYNMRILGQIKLVISEIYGDEYEIYYIDSAGVKEQEKIEKLPIYLLDRVESVGPLTSIYIPRVEEKNKEIFDFNDLVDIMDVLRGEDGCPWDIKQTHESLRDEMIEEAFELVNAINNEDYDNIVEELGDVLLQVVFHSKIGEDEGTFNLVEVTTELVKKLIYRHPHIFSENKVVNSDKVLYNWDSVKDAQKNYKSKTEKMNDITQNLPELSKSYKIQKIAKEVGFDWPSIDGSINKLYEEAKELEDAIEEDDKVHVEEELGDLLFSIVNIARFLDIDPVVALNGANEKFKSRFKTMEKIAKDDNVDMSEMSISDLDKLWNLAKEKNV